MGQRDKKNRQRDKGTLEKWDKGKIKGKWDKITMGQRNKGIKGQRDKGTMGQCDEGTKGKRRDKRTKG